MRVQIVDPSAFTPPYDHALSAALARAGAEVELVTTRFLHGPVPREDGYRVTEAFYPSAARRGLEARGRAALKLVEHVPGMLRLRRMARDADVVHYQWLAVPPLDLVLLPPARPRVLTLHNVLPHEPVPGAAAATRRLLGRMDAVVVHSDDAASRAARELGADPSRVHVIPHGAFDYLTRIPRPAPLPPELEAVRGPVVLSFGLMRPYKGIDTLIEAFREVDGAELWVVGRAMMPLEPLRALAERIGPRVRLIPRFITDAEIPAYFRRADVVALPYRAIDQSGVLFTALAFGRPLVLTSVGGFVEVAERHGAAVLVPPEDPAALAAAINRLLSDRGARERLGAAATAAAAGPYSWDAIGERTLALYRSLTP
jgi:glycosyltransferase involved in cell wall biosynthesis